MIHTFLTFAKFPQCYLHRYVRYKIDRFNIYQHIAGKTCSQIMSLVLQLQFHWCGPSTKILAIKGMIWFFSSCIFQNCNCILCFDFFFKYQLFADYNKIMIISLKLNFRVLADSTLLCLVNTYQDGNDCKGIALF